MITTELFALNLTVPSPRTVGGRELIHVGSAVAVADDEADGVGVGLAEVRAVAIDDGLGAVEDGVVSGDRPGGSIWRSAKTRPVAIAEAAAARTMLRQDFQCVSQASTAPMKPTKKRIARAVMPIGLPGRRTTSRRKLATAASTATALIT